MDTNAAGTAGGNPKRNQKESQMRWVVKDQPLQRWRQVDTHRIRFEEDGPKQYRSRRPVDDQCLLEIHDDMATGDEKEKDQKFGEINCPCTAENPDTKAREKVKAKEEKLGEVYRWCTMERAKVKTNEKLPDVNNWSTIEIPNDMATMEREREREREKEKEQEEEREKKKKKKKQKEKEKKKKKLEKEMEKLEMEKEMEKLEKPKPKLKLKPKPKPKKPKPKDKEQWFMDNRNQDLIRLLLSPKLTWEEEVVDVLHMVRCRGFTEYNNKLHYSLPTRFCAFNIAFFDLDKESEDVPWPPIHQIPLPLRDWLDDSVNIIAIKVAKSDMKYPISMYGTVLARDEYDYRCIYLFRRGRDDPQLITSKDNALTLISPIRAFAVRDSMFFEFHLKIKGDGDVDEDFSKGYIEHSAIRHTRKPTTKLLDSCLSSMELVYTPIPFALEASIAVSVLKAPSDFTSKVTAWTTGNDEIKIVLYDSEVADTRTKLGPGGSVCGLVAVPLDEDLVLRVCVFYEGHHEVAECFELVVGYEVDEPGHDVDERTVERGPFKLQVKISWKGVKNRRGYSSWGRPNMWGHLGGGRVLM